MNPRLSNLRVCLHRKSVVIGLFFGVLMVITWVGWNNARDSTDKARSDDKQPEVGLKTQKTAPVAASGGHLESAPANQAPKTTQAASDPWGLKSLNATQTVARMIKLSDEFKALEAQVYAANPQLLKIAQWLKTAEADYREQNKDLLDNFATYQDSNQNFEKDGQLGLLARPAAFLNLANDPTFGPWFKEAYEIAGLNARFPSSLSEMDRLSGYPNRWSNSNPLSDLNSLRRELENRVSWYADAFRDYSAKNKVPSWRVELSRAEEQFEQSVKVAELYHDSFFGGRLHEIELEFEAATKRLKALQDSGQDNVTAEQIALLRTITSRRLQVVDRSNRYLTQLSQHQEHTENEITKHYPLHMPRPFFE